MEADSVKAAQQNTGSIYATNLPQKPNPRATPPSHWTTEASQC